MPRCPPGSPAAATLLLRCGASADVPVLRGLQLRIPHLCGGSTPLHIAAFQGDARMCLVLLEVRTVVELERAHRQGRSACSVTAEQRLWFALVVACRQVAVWVAAASS